MHQWGDKWFKRYGSRLDRACDRLRKLTKRFRLGGDIKEKYGTLRFYVKFHSQLHDLIWPGYVYNQYPYDWMWSFDLWLTCSSGLQTCLYWRLVGKWILRIQYFGYRWSYSKLVKEFRSIKKEILSAADYRQELLKGL